MRASWLHRKTNEDVLGNINEKETLMKNKYSKKVCYVQQSEYTNMDIALVSCSLPL